MRWFKQYCQASSLTDKGEECQVSTLLYYLGEDAEEVLDTTWISAEEKKKYSKVIDEFDKYFKVKKNIIYEHARFNRCSQLADHSADHFITKIHKLVENYEFEAMKDKLICDRLVIRIRDPLLSECLQLEPELTLDRLIHQRESVQCQQEFLKVKLEKQWPGEISLVVVRQPTTRRKLPAIPPAPTKPSLNNCHRCGSGTYPYNHALQKMQTVLDAIDVDTSALSAYLIPLPTSQLHQDSLFPNTFSIDTLIQ